jgi:hypothetical protein
MQALPCKEIPAPTGQGLLELENNGIVAEKHKNHPALDLTWKIAILNLHCMVNFVKTTQCKLSV